MSFTLDVHRCKIASRCTQYCPVHVRSFIVAGYEDKENVHSMVTMDPIKVRNHYLAGWFMIDFISSCPVDNLILPFIHLNSSKFKINYRLVQTLGQILGFDR